MAALRTHLASSMPLLLAACGGPASRPARGPEPAAAPAPALPAPTGPTLTFNYLPGRYRVQVHNEAQVSVSERDATAPNALRPDSQAVRSDVFVSLVALPSTTGLTVSGQVDSTDVTPPRLPGAGTGRARLVFPLQFEATISPRGHLLLRPPSPSRTSRDTTACWSETRALLDPLHALYPAVPPSLTEGAHWRDTVEFATCRLGIPVHIREVRDLTLRRVTSADGAVVGDVDYISRTVSAGERTEGDSRVLLGAEGESRGTLRLDVGAGFLRTDDSEDRYRLVLLVEGRERVLTQHARRRVTLTPVE